MSDKRRFVPTRGSYKKVRVDRRKKELITEAINRCPEEWGPARLAAYVHRQHRVTVTPDEVATVLGEMS